jgi:hypothetical protein
MNNNLHPDRIELIPIALAFLRYSFFPIGYDWHGLTPAEKALCTKEQFERLCDWAREEV